MLQVKNSPVHQVNRQSRGGFTLIQLVVVVGILAVLSAVLFSVLGRSKGPAQRAKCDVQLKQIVGAINQFRQERNRMPVNLTELVQREYITADVLRCPEDTDFDANKAKDPKYTSYNDGYLIREPRDSQQLPVLLCYFHEKSGHIGAQGFKGGYTKHFDTLPSSLKAGDYEGVVTITRPGTGVLVLPKSGQPPLELRGGDRIKTGAGKATVNFQDGSNAAIQANTEMTVLQSYKEGQRGGMLYNLVRQFSGRVNYYCNPGSGFDVATPTATAGAVGTRFTIEIIPAASLGAGVTTLSANELETVLTVTEHTVALSTTDRTILVNDREPAVAAHDPKNLLKPRRSSAAASASATSSPTPTPTSSGNGNNGNGNGNNGNNGNGNGNNGNNGNGNGNNGNNGNGGNSGHGNGDDDDDDDD